MFASLLDPEQEMLRRSRLLACGLSGLQVVLRLLLPFSLLSPLGAHESEKSKWKGGDKSERSLGSEQHSSRAGSCEGSGRRASPKPTVAKGIVKQEAPDQFPASSEGGGLLGARTRLALVGRKCFAIVTSSPSPFQRRSQHGTSAWT